METFRRTALGRRLTIAAGLFLVGCTGTDPSTSAEGDVGVVSLAVAIVPTDIACIRLAVASPVRVITRSLSVAAGGPFSAMVAGLPIGKVTIGADAFNSACTSVNDSATPTWVSQPVETVLSSGVPTPVALSMQRPGRIDVTIDFQDITSAVKTPGCAKTPPAMGGARTVNTMGTKAPDCADSKCGPWNYVRQYVVTLPAGYVSSKAYPLVFEGPGCGGSATNVYPLNDGTAPNVGNSVIRVGVTPPPNDIGHSTNPNQGCFDDREGDDSVEFAAYEAIYDKVADEFCFDKNRVFIGGNTSGGTWANEIGCKYAGNASRPIRGVFANGAALPTEPKYRPTCSTKPMAGLWSHAVGDTIVPFAGAKEAISRAMQVNGCTIGTSYDDAVAMNALEDFPIGTTNPPNTCRKIKGCPGLYPLVVCALPGTAHSSNDTVVNPGVSTFIKLFSAGPFINP